MRPSKAGWLARIVEDVATRSTCSRLNVGAIIVDGTHPVAMGYNGSASGEPHCIHVDDSPCTTAVHAEANALVDAARRGVRIEGLDMLCTHAPCLGCARLIINAGIRRVDWLHEYRSLDGVKLLAFRGIAFPVEDWFA